MAVNREIVESPVAQGADEIIAYTLTTTQWGSTPSSVAVTVFSVVGDVITDVTTTVMPVNSPSVSGDVITLSPLKLLTVGVNYRLEIKFTSSGNVFEAFATINGER